MMVSTGSMNCYEYLKACTEPYGEYDALEHFGKRITRTAFLKDVDGLAAYFQQELRLRRGDVYTVFLPTSAESYVAFYALNKIGVITNFIHPLSPPHVLQELMAASGTKGIMMLDMIAAKYVEVVKQFRIPVIVCSYADYAATGRKPFIYLAGKIAGAGLGRIPNKINYTDACKKYPPLPGLSGNGNDTAVYLCGGGTTGHSKTIKLSSHSINEVIYKFADVSAIRDPGEEAIISVLPLFHAFGLCISLHLVMCNAARIIPMSRFNAKRFNAISRKRRICFIIGIPVMFRKLMAEENFDGSYLKNLRLLFCGGDSVNESVLNKFNGYMEKWGAEGRLMRGYGLTEVASVCSVNVPDFTRKDSVGMPIKDVRMEIWDEAHNRLPNGEIGEIAISGSTVMQGYFEPGKAPDDGIYTDPQGRKWVLSGDLGWQDNDGYFYFSGRKKRMIIISGYNVYPMDIEMKVEELPYIKEVCAVQGYDAQSKPIVRLYISLTKNAPNEESCKKEILHKCETDLNPFCVPREIVVMDFLPRTAMQKIDFVKLTQESPIPDS